LCSKTFLVDQLALHWACKNNNQSGVEYLLEHGATPIQSNDGKYPYELTKSEEIRNLFPGTSTSNIKSDVLKEEIKSDEAQITHIDNSEEKVIFIS
jgi:ankyrin repeat protein